MDPTPQTTPATAAPPTTGGGFVELVRTRRQEVAYALLAAAAALLLLVVWMGFKAMKPGDAAADSPPVEINLTNPAKPTEIANPKRGDYLVGGLAVLNGFLVLATVGTFLLVSIPPPEPEKQRATVRLGLLLAGTELGVVLILAGLAFIYRWSDSMLAYLDKDATATKQVWKVMVPLLMIALGAGVTFLSILPARADERSSPAIRRAVYGSNLAMTVLLLLIALVIGNVIVAMKVPNKLDVTTAALSSISKPTTQLIEQMTEPVTVYLIGEEGRDVTTDTRNLLERMAEVNPTKLKVVVPSLTADKQKLRELMAKYPAVEAHGLGVLLTTGPDEKRHAFIRMGEMTTTEDAGEGAQPGERRRVFQGEEKIVRELSFLTEGGKKPIVYVVQGGRELSMGGGRAGPEKRSMSILKGYLERNNLDVRPLVFDPVTPAVPPDADVLMIPDPTAPYPPPIVQAIDAYMTKTRGDGAKGKLLLFVGATPAADGKIPKTGLEPLLERFGVGLRDRLIMSSRTSQAEWLDVIPYPTDAALEARNPIAGLFARGVVPWEFCRPLALPPAPPGGPFRVLPLFESSPQRLSWVEESMPSNLQSVLGELQTSAEVRRRKELSAQERPLAALVSENPPPGAPGQPPGNPIPRLAVFGAGEFVSDAVARRSGPDAHPNIELIGATADWLRERPVVGGGIVPKTYVTYKLSSTADETRLVLVPLGLAILIVVGLGAGVWVIRRS